MPRDDKPFDPAILARAQELADSAPALTTEQRARLAGLLKAALPVKAKPKPKPRRLAS